MYLWIIWSCPVINGQDFTSQNTVKTTSYMFIVNAFLYLT